MAPNRWMGRSWIEEIGRSGMTADRDMERGVCNKRCQEENSARGMRGRIHSLNCLVMRA